MKVPVYTLKGQPKGTVEIAKAFSAPVRKDVIKRAVAAERAAARQAYGADPVAGHRSSAHYHGKRHYRHTMMNREMARMKRIHGSGFLHFTARVVPQARKGRKAHPPKAEKIWDKKVNKKEMALAMLSAVSASADKEMLAARGHILNGAKSIPLVLEDSVQGLKRTKETAELLKALGLEDEMVRVSEKKIRQGKGKARGRKYRTRTGPLFIVKEDNGLVRASMNLPGVDSATVTGLSVEMLAPGGQPGRLCIWSKSALEEFEKTLSGKGKK
jgi:large subunit ribosomal protein L4e